MFSPVGPIQVNAAYNPYPRPAGPIYYDAPFDPVTRTAPLYCVTPGNDIPITDPSSKACPADFKPQQSRSFFGRLTFTFSIGPDF